MLVVSCLNIFYWIAKSDCKIELRRLLNQIHQYCILEVKNAAKLNFLLIIKINNFIKY